MRSDAVPISDADLEYWVRRNEKLRELLEGYRDMAVRVGLKEIDAFYRISVELKRRRGEDAA